MTPKPHFYKRNHLDGLIVPDVDFAVKRYSKNAYGGPREATIDARGYDIELWELLELLRCPVRIFLETGEPVWWGYISSVDLVVRNPDSLLSGRVKVGAEVETMANRVAIAYTQVDLSTGDQSRATTDWADDVESQAEYGIKELLDSRSAASAAHADAARDKTLADLKYPITVLEPDPGARESRASITCAGWWNTLGWRYYANAGTASVDTAEQVKDILDAKGQFFGTVYQDVTSNLAVSEKRDGDATALYEAVELLNLGTDNFLRMLAEVDVNRNVRIYEEPVASDGAYIINSNGDITTKFGEPIERATCPTAFWVTQGDLIPGSLDTVKLSDPRLKFVEEMEYKVDENQLYPTAKDAPDPWAFPIVKPG